MRKLISKIFYEKKIAFLFVFFSFFFLYVLLGMCIAYPTSYGANLFFGADNGRVYNDIVYLATDHVRIKVHPLFLLLVQPIVHLAKGIVFQETMTVLLLQGFCGAMADLMFYLILEKLKVDSFFLILLLLIYGLSFSNIIFSAVPETFIFAGVGLIAYWFYVLAISEASCKLGKIEICVLIFFGIISFGITLTNYFSYSIGLIYLLLKKEKDKRQGVKTYIRINGINGLGIVILCKMQTLIWHNAPFFWTSIFDALFHGVQYEEAKYMDWGINFSKIIQWIRQTMFYPFISPNVYMASGTYSSICFGDYHHLVEIVSVIFIIVAVVAIMAYILKLIRNKYKDLFFGALFLTWIGNMCLHFIYGSAEAFIYSPHYHFLFLLLAGYSFSALENKILKQSLQIGLVAVVIVELINNLYRFFDTVNLALDFAGVSYSMMKSIKGAILATVMLFVIVGVKSYCDKMANVEKMDITITVWRCICMYIVLLLITGVYMAFAY